MNAAWEEGVRFLGRMLPAPPWMIRRGVVERGRVVEGAYSIFSIVLVAVVKLKRVSCDCLALLGFEIGGVGRQEVWGSRAG